jgi:hypothetical protein
MNVCLIILFCLITALAPDRARADITNPAAWWRLDENSGSTANDSSGNGKHGTLQLGASWTSGKLAYAVSLDGSDDQVALPTALGINNVNAFSISMWVKQTSLTDYRILFSQRAASDSSRIEIFTSGFGQGTDNDIQVAVCNGGNFQEAYSESGVLDDDDVWRHIVVVYDGSQGSDADKLKLYVNAALQQQLHFNASIPSSSPNIPTTASYLGRRGDAGTSAFPGAVDDVRVYTRALTQNDVTELYNYRRPEPLTSIIPGSPAVDPVGTTILGGP